MREIKLLRQKKKNKSIGRKILEVTLPPLAMLVISSIFICLVTILLSQPVLDLNSMDKFACYIEYPVRIKLNLYPILIFTSIVYLLVNRLWLAVFLSGLGFMGLALISKLKMQYINSPLKIGDFAYMGELCRDLKFYGAGISKNIYILGGVFFLLVVFLKVFFNFKIEDKRLRNIYLVSIFIVASSFCFKNYIELDNPDISGFNLSKEVYMEKGFVDSFLRDWASSRRNVRTGEEEDLGRQILDNYRDYEMDEDVSIITILVEDYDDFTDYRDLNIDKKIYENYRKAREDSISGGLIVNDGRIRTEREYLTGYIDNRDYRDRVASHTSYLKDSGYRTEYMLNDSLKDYKRLDVNRKLGFDRSVRIDGSNLSEAIIGGYEEAQKAGKSYFNFSRINLNKLKVGDHEGLIIKDGLSKEDRDLLNLYFSSLREVDRELGLLLDYFKDQGPTILVFMSGGSPNLGKNQEVYTSLGVNIDSRTQEGFLNKYRLPYLVWGNESLRLEFNKSFVKDNGDLSPNFLLADIFDYLDLRGSSYIQYLNDKKEDYRVNNKFYFKTEEAYIRTDKLPDYLIQSYREFRAVERYRLRRSKERPAS